jgi:putative hydrolase of the HAD superfamily
MNLTDGMSAVVFDFFGTLTPISPDSVWAGYAAQLAALIGVSPDALFAALNDTFSERMTGATGDVRQTMQWLATRLGVRLSDERLTSAVAARRRFQESMFALRPEAVPAISKLRQSGMKIGLLSDCSQELPDAWHKLPLAELVDAPVFSCLEGTRKPDPRLFRTVAANLDVPPAACVYVGDGGGRELTGASSVGMRAVLLAGSDWRQHHAHDEEPGWTGPRIASLAEL